MPPVRSFALVAALLTTTISCLAFAQEGAPALPDAPEDDKPPAPRPTAPDTRSDHPTFALQYGLLRMMGSAEQDRSHSSILGWGLAPGLQLAYPFRRDFAVEVWGSYGTLSTASNCRNCEGTSWAAGLGAVYHMIDGIPLDPWFSAGFGYRKTQLETPTLGKVNYSGLTALRLAMGSDYYFTPAVGIGPYLEFTLGRYLARDPGTINEGAMHTSLGAGLRVVFSPFLMQLPWQNDCQSSLQLYNSRFDYPIPPLGFGVSMTKQRTTLTCLGKVNDAC